jgi:putative glycosyl hydrolase-like family 15 (GHL15) protein
VMRSMRWGLTLALMAGAYYEIIVDDRHATLWWYDEYDGGKGIRRRGYLGQPLGPSVRLRTGGVWRRDFEQGIALNNSTSKSVSIELKKQYRRLRGTQNPRLNDGSVVTRVTLPPDDGLILLNVRQK